MKPPSTETQIWCVLVCAFALSIMHTLKLEQFERRIKTLETQLAAPK